MTSSYFKSIRKTKEYNQMIDSLKNRDNVLLHHLEEEGMTLIASMLSSVEEKQVLILVPDEMKAIKLHRNASAYFNKAFHLKAKQLALYGVDALSRDNMNSRLEVINRIITGETMLIIASIDAYSDFVMDKERLIGNCFEIQSNSTIDLTNISRLLTQLGYHKVPYIEGKGQYSIRGGIFDVFSPAMDTPCRIELFDDEVDSMRSFDVTSQRSIENMTTYRVIPCCEIIINDEEAKETKLRISQEIDKRLDMLSHLQDKHKIEDQLDELRASMTNAIDSGDYIDNVQFYAPYLPIKLHNIGDYLNDNSTVIIYEPDLIAETRKNKRSAFIEKFSELYASGQVLSQHEKIFDEFETVVRNIKNKLSFIVYNQIDKKQSNFGRLKEISIKSRENTPYHSKIDELAKEINKYKYKGYKIFLETSQEESARKLQQELYEKDCQVSLSYEGKEEVLSGQASVSVGTIEKGLEFSDWKIKIISSKEIFGSQTIRKKTKKKYKASKIDSFTDLKPGDYVVHEYHGIGVYSGIEKVIVRNIQKDYLSLHYNGGDKLYVPVDQMGLVQKYIGSDSVKPKINRLSGSEWTKAKAKAQKMIDEMADELIELYSQRLSEKGYAFSEDTEWQKEFENAFEHQETEDQARSSEEIKRDMMKEVPMDRLLCGDVGFGKTEVALRAVFKAVMDGKQVAILVPTTILAQQHFTNISQRFSNYPIKIEMLSRFRSPGQQRKIISDINRGLLDVVIGTHKLLSKEIHFKDIGLLVIDEEQRFGVRHKEMIKRLKTNIDVLTLTATPIPRTLNMSMVGIRDMSIIEEPPKERYSVQTFVMSYNESIIKDAIVNELSRGGQVYYVHNRVHDIHSKATRIKEMLPDVRVTVAHGQMGERELENVMVDFVHGEYDVLVCTTIIETGMDIANVNTMIIDHADKFGLSQLYQLRGRVGRSNKVAFAYLMYEKNKVLTEVAEKRLKAVKEFTEFGSGFKIAMRDLEIRGAGNILGSQQSGHLSAIGYDLYVKMIERTLKQRSGKTTQKQEIETVIELDVDGYISPEYIDDVEQKIEIYKKISSIENEEDVTDITDEIIDRFGDIPKEVRNLIKISHIKAICKELNIISLRQQSNFYIIEFKDVNSISDSILSGILTEHSHEMKFDLHNKPILKYRPSKKDEEDQLTLLENTFKNLYNLSIKLNNETHGGKS
ncbi:MAG: transcription-repair coupling factor [Tissierellales bacterium]|nr:transcription-repair coupling factor [Tissierellales bacterium]